MSFQNCEKPSAFTKLQQAYWEAKRNLNSSVGNCDDECIISNDSELDTKIDFLRAADNNFNELLTILQKYNTALQGLMLAEDNLGSALIEYGIKDTTKAGKLMSISGKSITRCANRRAPLKTMTMKLFHEIQTFHFKATVDVLQTVTKMERVRKSYRSGLMWMKNESKTLNPDISRKLSRFRRVQDHIRKLKVDFDRSKIESMQKIDLYLLSRCNLFSQTLVPYRKVFCKMSRNVMVLTKSAIQNIPTCMSFKFETLKQLNDFSTTPHSCLDPLSSGHKSMDAHKNYNKLKSHSRESTKYIPNEQNRNSSSTTTSNPKKITLKERCKSMPSGDVGWHNTESLLIRLTPEIDRNRWSTFNDSPISIADETLKQQNSLTGKYSCDLLSLCLDDSQSGDSVKQDDDFYSNVFENEYEDCFRVLDPIQPSAQETDSDLQFWSLMECFENIKEGDTSEAADHKDVDNFDTNLIQMSEGLPVSYWESVLVEFDPYSGYPTRFMKAAVVEENC